jgi:hypothetical protein
MAGAANAAAAASQADTTIEIRNPIKCRSSANAGNTARPGDALQISDQFDKHLK